MSSDFHAARIDELKNMNVSLQEKNRRLTKALREARDELLDMNAQLEKLSAAPATICVCTNIDMEAREVEVAYGSKIMRLALAPYVDISSLSPGHRVRVSSQMVVVSSMGPHTSGDIVTVQERVDSSRVLAMTPCGNLALFMLNACLCDVSLKPGDTLVCDLQTGIAYEKLVRQDIEQLLTPTLAHVSYSDIGGLDEQIEHVRDAVELPFKNPQLYRDYGLKPPKGVLLYGPPGCGKTLIAKAIATSLGSVSSHSSPYFLSIKGPELLSKFVGETERQIRAIFSRARTLARNDSPVVIFFDEMEALFRTRGSGISSDVETMIVPQLLAEIDGIENLDNVVVIGASNREDMIDPAIVRSGRLDVRVRIDRPHRQGAYDIMRIHCHHAFPLDSSLVSSHGDYQEALTYLQDKTIDMIFTCGPQTAVYQLTFESGQVVTHYLSDVLSGAMIASIVENAKKRAIKDILHERVDSGHLIDGVTWDHMRLAVLDEVEGAIDMASSIDVNQWARTTGRRADERVVSIQAMKRRDETPLQ